MNKHENELEKRFIKTRAKIIEILESINFAKTDEWKIRNSELKHIGEMFNGSDKYKNKLYNYNEIWSPASKCLFRPDAYHRAMRAECVLLEVNLSNMRKDDYIKYLSCEYPAYILFFECYHYDSIYPIYCFYTIYPKWVR